MLWSGRTARGSSAWPHRCGGPGTRLWDSTLRCTGQAITVDYVATSGNRTLRTLSRLVLDPPYLEAWCHLRDAERVFTLSRIHGVMPG
jgi:hypothetical protein